MPESVLDQLDKHPKDQQVDVKEIQDALKEGFFDKEENRDILQQEFNGKPEWVISELAKSFDNSLSLVKSDLTSKIKANEKLTPQEIKILKLDALIEKKVAYKDTDFGNTDWAKDVTIRGFVTSINPYYQQAPLGQKTTSELFGSKDIQNDIPALNQSLAETYDMVADFLVNMQATMTSPGSTDYRLQNSIISDVSKFLEANPLKKCSSYAEYQQHIKNIADFFNTCIHSNGLLDDQKNPAFVYFVKNASVQTGSQTIGPTACIKFGNMLTAMSTIKALKDKEKIKGGYYALTREILGGSMYGLYKEGSLGSFGQGQNMEKLQGDIVNSEEMQKYPDLKIIADYLKNMKIDSQKDGQDQMDLTQQFERLINKLNGKVPTAIVAYLRTQFDEKKEDIQKSIDVMTSGESLTNMLTISGMQVLASVFEGQKVQLSESEIAMAGEYYLTHGEFQPSIMTLFQMKYNKEGTELKQYIKELIKQKTNENIIKQRNMVIYNRLSRFALTSALSSDPVRADAIYKKNALFKVYNDVEGIGEEGGWSDARIQGLKAIADEIVVTILVTAFSGGVASLAVRGVFGAIRAATIGGKIALFAAKMIVEGIVFHATTVGVNALISQDRETMLEELKSPEAWARSILYLGVMRGVSKVLQMPLALGSKSLQNIATPVQLARFAKGVAMPMEIGGMMITDQVLSLTFDQQLQAVTLESFIQTVTLVVGLKAAHKIIPSIPEAGDIKSDGVEITGMTKKDGTVTDISYRQKILNTIDAKVDYLAQLCKIKSGVRSQTAKNILNSIDAAFAKNPARDYYKPLEEVKKTIEQLRQEGKLPKSLEEKYNEIVSKTKTEKTQPTIDPAIVEANKNRSKYSSQEIQRLYDEGKKGESLLIKDLKQKMKEGVITPAEYTRQVKEFQSTFPAYGDVQVAKNTETIAKYSYPISQETIDRYIANIGENIQGGGGNAEGVHIIKGTNLVAVIKGEGSYVYELPQKTLMSGLTTTRVPRVVDVFVHEGKTYKIMEKSPGIQIDKLSAQQLSEIPQEHYNNFVKDVKEIENAGLSVDPSKPSNFFYDAETGFHLIDLAVRGDNKRSMFDQVGNFNAKGILDNGKINEAVKNLEHTESSNQIKPDPAIVKANSLNSDKLIIDGKINLEAKNTIEQILREGKVLGEKETLTDEKIRIIYEAHNLPGELYNLSFGETRSKVEVLKKAEFTSEQIRVLMDNGICGEISEKGIYAAIESYKSVENITVDNKDITVDNILSSEEYKLFIEGIDDVEVMKKNAEFLYFSENKDAVPVSSKKQDFYNALKDGDNETAKKLYKDAVYTTIKKFDNIGLTVQNNIKLIEYFRTRNYDGVKEMRSKIVEKNEVTKTKDTESQFAKKSVDKETGEETIEYNDVVKNEYSDPNTGERVLLTRKELHEKIIEKFLSEGEPAVGDKELILSGGMPGAGKGSIEKNLVGAHVKVNPDLVKDYLPEYYDADGNKFGAEIVHEESSYISKIVYDRAVEKGLSIFYDSSMKDNSSKNFPKYNKIVNAAYKQGYKIEGRFIYDGGEARYRNTIIRERTMPLDNYSAYSSSYETIEFLSKDPRVSRVEILDNSLNGKKSDSKIVYENQKINMEKSDKDLVKKVEEYSEFLKKL